MPAETHTQGDPMSRDEILTLIKERLADILRSFADSKLRTDTFLHDENSVAQRHSLKQALIGPGSFGGELDKFQKCRKFGTHARKIVNVEAPRLHLGSGK